MGIYTEGFAARQRAKRRILSGERAPEGASQWELRKRVRNIKDGNHPTKGLKDGRCNRTACQEPLTDRHQWTMVDFEQSDRNERLYYCGPCARMFNNSDRQCGTTIRCTPVN